MKITIEFMREMRGIGGKNEETKRRKKYDFTPHLVIY
jgi:hypothetical protein